MRPAEVSYRLRSFGAVNWRGLWSLYRREMKRYFKYAIEALGGPIVSSLLFLAVFTLAAGEEAYSRVVAGGEGPDLGAFIAPGIAAFSLALSAFHGGCFPVLYDKLEGMITDVIGAPLTEGELVFGFILSAATMGLLTGAGVAGAALLFVDLEIQDPLGVLLFAVLLSLVFATLGFIVGLWADTWDRCAAVETFLVMPLGLLSGSFFPLASLPELGQQAIRLNPVFYGIDGFRAGFIGWSDSSALLGAPLLAGLFLALYALAWHLIRRGYKIKP